MALLERADPQAAKFRFNSVGKRELGEVWVLGRSVCQVGKEWSGVDERLEEETSLARSDEVQVNGPRALTEAGAVRRNTAGGVGGTHRGRANSSGKQVRVSGTMPRQHCWGNDNMALPQEELETDILIR